MPKIHEYAIVYTTGNLEIFIIRAASFVAGSSWRKAAHTNSWCGGPRRWPSSLLPPWKPPTTRRWTRVRH
jgi:hypothetical protein